MVVVREFVMWLAMLQGHTINDKYGVGEGHISNRVSQATSHTHTHEQFVCVTANASARNENYDLFAPLSWDHVSTGL